MKSKRQNHEKKAYNILFWLGDIRVRRTQVWPRFLSHSDSEFLSPCSSPTFLSKEPGFSTSLSPGGHSPADCGYLGNIRQNFEGHGENEYHEKENYKWEANKIRPPVRGALEIYFLETFQSFCFRFGFPNYPEYKKLFCETPIFSIFLRVLRCSNDQRGTSWSIFDNLSVRGHLAKLHSRILF